MRLSLCFLLSMPLLADISGFVRDQNGNPVAGARVRVQATLDEPVLSAADGSFTLVLASGTNLEISAAKVYDPQQATNFITAATTADNGDTGIIIVLPAIPSEENLNYFPIKARTPDGCGDCHELQLAEWEFSRHADTAQNTWVNDVFASWSAQNPGQTGFCASCHAPAADSQDPGNVFLNQLNSLPLLDRASALEGVNCSSCHQIDHVNDNFTALHLNGNATMRFPLAGIAGSGTHDYVWGPLDDVDYPFMKAVYNPQFRQSELCASCHEYANPNNGTPAQTTYSEWLASDYGDPKSPNFASCQDCHMDRGSAPAVLCDPPPGLGGGPLRSGASHGNHGITGTVPQDIAQALAMNLTSAVVDGRLRISVDIQNMGAGHSFPTGVSVRNAILRVLATDNLAQPLNQTAGEVVPFYGSDSNGTPDQGDWAGLPGRGFAKVLEGVGGIKPVLFIDAVTVAEDTRIAAGATETSAFEFEIDNLPCNGGTIDIEAILTYRRAWRATVVTMGWTTDNRGQPWELELKNIQLSLSIQQLAIAMWNAESPAAGFDTNANGLIDILDLVLQGTCD